MIAILFEQREMAYGTLDHHTYLQVLLTGNALARVVHVLLASFAVTGLALVGLARCELNQNCRKQTAWHNSAGRLHWCVAAAASRRCLGVVGVARTQSQRIMSSGTAILFGIAVVTALWLMHQLAMIALGDVSRRRLSMATLMMAYGRRADDRHFAIQPMNSPQKKLAAT